MADKKQPSKDAERLANLLADQQIDLDEIAEEYSEKHLKIFTDLLNSTKNRDEAVFKSADADISLTVSDFSEVPLHERDDNWDRLWAGVYSACYMQSVANSGLLKDLIIISENHSSAIIKTTKKIKKMAIVEVAKEGVLNGKLKERKTVRG